MSSPSPWRSFSRGSELFSVAGEEHSLLTCGDLTLDLTGHTVSRGGEELPLSAKEYALLEYLLYNKKRILSREMIEDHIWNYDYEGGTNVVDVYVSYLRHKIDDGREVYNIEFTVPGKAEYDYEIDAATGEILEEDVEDWDGDD